MNICKLLKTTNNVQRQLLRAYAFKSDLKIKWVRPEKIPCTKPEKSGDLGKLPPVSEQEFLVQFKDSKELQTADPAVQSLFQLGNNRNIDTSRYYRKLLIKEVQRHPLDYGSMEAKLAWMTARIRCLQDQLEQFPRNTKVKVTLKELIDKRKKYLKHLRRWDYRRFEWILEKLDLVYKPPPTEFHWITRKESLQKLTDQHCENIKRERLEAYRKELESQQIPFLEDSIKQLQRLQKEQIELEISDSVLDEKIAELSQQLDELKLKRNVDTNANGNEK